jgi:hypothetical protein
VLDGSLDAEGGAIVDAALRTATAADTDSIRSPAMLTPWSTSGGFFLDHQKDRPGAGTGPTST